MKLKTKLRIAIVSLIMIGLLLITVFELFSGKNQIEAVGGEIDLSEWNYSDTLPLTGKWNFYWDRFLTERDFKANPAPDLEMTVPSVWNGQIVAGQKLPGEGFATYRLHVTGAREGMPLALRLCPLSTAYRIYINDILMAACGNATNSKQDFEPKYEVKLFTFKPVSSEFDIIIHVSNYIYARGGAWYTPYIGTPEGIDRIDKSIAGRDFFLLGCFFIFIIFCIIVYLQRWQAQILFFMFICLFLIGRTAIYGNYTINIILPNIGFSTIVRIDYLSLYWLPTFYFMVINTIYKKDMPRASAVIILSISCLLTILTLALPVKTFTYFANVGQAFAVVIGSYVIVLLFRFMIQSKHDVTLLLIGVMILTFAAIHDSLFQNNNIRFGYFEYTPIGFLIMTLLWGCIFAFSYDKALRERQLALQELNDLYIRESRTELKFLKSQIGPHFINNALNTIISISRSDADQARSLLVEFSKYLRSFYDFSSLDDTVAIENELEHVKAYLALEKARFQDKLLIEYDIDNVSVTVPPLILQPLVENAVKHGVMRNSDGGKIRIYIKNGEGFVKIGVEDNGIGIPQEKLERIQKGNEESRGVGIFNVNRRLSKIYGTTLYIDRLDPGLHVYMLIPYVTKEHSI